MDTFNTLRAISWNPGRGIGAALYEALRELLASKGCCEPSEISNPSNPGSSTISPTCNQPQSSELPRALRPPLEEVVNTFWDRRRNPRILMIIYSHDSIDWEGGSWLHREGRARVVRRNSVLVFKYYQDDRFVEVCIVGSFKDDPGPLLRLLEAATRLVFFISEDAICRP